MLTAISPVDGRYATKTKVLVNYFSEFALIKYRVWVEIQYLIALHDLGIPQLEGIKRASLEQLATNWQNFSLADAEQIKTIERTTNHDVKAVEYYLKTKLEEIGLGAYKEFVHFALTSQDINNTAIPLSLKEAIQEAYLPQMKKLLAKLSGRAIEWEQIPMLARTHGQPASPTILGKEIQVFVNRIEVQLKQLKNIPFSAKFGGATGNMNAHFVTYPAYDWHDFAARFVADYLGLERSFPTTQIEHYDNLAALLQACMRINTILIDLCRDIWTYISIDYFKQQVIKGEVGSSAMPHKVNPIDFENAEGNLGVANALFHHLATKLPISRLQRDLTDSTVLRNLGVPFAHSLIAFQSIVKGLNKLLLHEATIRQDLENNWMVVAEAIQNILRREGYQKPYETLKELTRGKKEIDRKIIYNFIETLSVDNQVKEELKGISPVNYIGKI